MTSSQQKQAFWRWRLGPTDAKPAAQNCAFQQTIRQLRKRWQQRFILQQVLLFLPKCFAAMGLLVFVLVSVPLVTFTNGLLLAFVLLLMAIALKLMLLKRSRAYANITDTNVIAHFNQGFADLEHSTQLLAKQPGQLSSLEQLQTAKIQPRFKAIIKQQSQHNYPDLSPTIAKRTLTLHSMAALMFCVLLAFSHSMRLVDKTLAWYQAQLSAQPNTLSPSAIAQQPPVLDILAQQVQIVPPAYSIGHQQAKSWRSESLDITTLVGSSAQWHFTFSQPNLTYAMVFSNGERHILQKNADGSHSLQRKLMTSMVYHLSVVEQDVAKAENFASIYRIALTPDQAPNIRFIYPKNTVTEYAKNSVPKVHTQVQITDDFAVSQVKILSSIAKGTGEAVKFRDQQFDFDRSELQHGKQHYFKTWSLAALGMVPGDELYFSVIATDNRQPEPQQSRSETKIIRWLEQESSTINAEGIVIDFMPEYFKSQRQIIIDTLELIADKSQLKKHEFTERSELLGVAQSALKVKYGQYLGDESAEQHSVGVTMDKEHSSAEQAQPEVHVHDHGGASNAVITPESPQHALLEHEHNGVQQGLDLSGKMALINRYGHNHEDTDVGVMTSQDPKALMKQSLANMWQAELHLMLAEPKRALPFEQQALQLLKLAKKAERIYVKRLGFEPPPVTEQRRYQGEQTDILDQGLQQAHFHPSQLSNQTQLAFAKLLELVQRFLQTGTDADVASQQALLSTKDASTALAQVRTDKGVLTIAQLALVEAAKQGIVQLIEKRPALVAALAVLEQILLEQQLQLSQCRACLRLLAGELEQLLPQPLATPHSKVTDFIHQQPLIKHYGQFLEDNL
ncbi:hypothetical protein SAMN05216262_10874 [Colwellia chukchiensis]|uniref:DUF4175 domain-containing protein n=1 Tax=Colwellia chukchiensis TaxID=641665 RepID=A0A1H7NTN9_9GAMM|nr:hypothetical protein [Colwellia chukchiensis]SEL26385.1 hypothetical protein SAMN05216262_10874 [Colwellia chukchiensis]